MQLLSQVNRVLERDDKAPISASQLRYDLADMQSQYGAPIEAIKEGRSVLYCYEDPEFSIKELPVSEEDITKLNQAVEMLRQINGFAIAEDVAEVVQRLEHKFKLSTSKNNPAIHFEQAPDSEYLEDLYLSIIRKQVLKIFYKKFTATEGSEYIVHPYLLKEYQKRWYLLGYSEERQAARTFALDRIRSIHVVPGQYIENTFITNERYFRDVIGVTITETGPELVHLWFSPDVAPFILTKPLHHSQIESNNSDGLRVQLKVMINPELISIVLSYGANCRVLEPISLMYQIMSAADGLCQIYNN